MALRVFTSGFTVAAPAGLSRQDMSSYLQVLKFVNLLTSKKMEKKKGGKFFPQYFFPPSCTIVTTSEKLNLQIAR
jgi:hypothetical protein